MPISPEREPRPEEIEERAEAPEIPEDIEKGGVRARPAQFTAQVGDDKGKPLIQTPQTKTVTIQLPTDQTTLTSLAKGSITSSLTWLAAFWLRMVKKAVHFGWRVMGRKKGGQDATSR